MIQDNKEQGGLRDVTPKDISPNSTYLQLLTEIQTDPYSQQLWEKTVDLAKSEETSSGNPTSFYTHVPLEELISVGARLRTIRDKDKQYQILTEKASTGERWYDIVLGHVNDKSFAPIKARLGELEQARGRRWKKGLDVGTGTGNTLTAIAPHFEVVTGVDSLAAVLDTVRDEKGLPPNATTVTGNATHLPFDANFFDVAVSNGLTHYLSKEDMQRYVTEVARVLKPGGLYYESFITKSKNSPLPIIEEEYLTSAKAMLTCLIDNLVSTPDPDQSRWGLRDMVETFQKNGFNYGMSEPNKEGVWFMEFHKIA